MKMKILKIVKAADIVIIVTIVVSQEGVNQK